MPDDTDFLADREILVLEGEEETLLETLAQVPDAEATTRLSEVRGHAGGVELWIGAIQASTTTLALLMPLVMERLKSGRITKVRVGDLEIEGKFTADEAKEFMSRLNPS